MILKKRLLKVTLLFISFLLIIFLFIDFRNNPTSSSSSSSNAINGGGGDQNHINDLIEGDGDLTGNNKKNNYWAAQAQAQVDNFKNVHQNQNNQLLVSKPHSDDREELKEQLNIPFNTTSGSINDKYKHLALGEFGKPVKLDNLTALEKKLVSDGWQRNAFNQFVSDLISLRRKLPDPRDQWCKEQDMNIKIDTSVIICFHNEAWSVLLRTVYSVLDRSPPHLIREIILVDDFSDQEHLKLKLDTFTQNLSTKIKIVRASKREGLIRARLLGADVATGQVLTFLDSHCECTQGWLEPLLDVIQKDSTTVVCPVIDVIDDDTLELHFSDSKGTSVGGFDWNLQFNWHAIPETEKKRRKNSAEPLNSPTMAGGLFSIDRVFFEKLGRYDPGFDIWGGENLELSFKTWMCHGTLQIVPCSHVGHIFRKRSPYKWRSGVNVLRRNSVRLAKVWMDEYADYYFQRIGHDLGQYGDISERLAIRDRLKCKSFKWYLENIYPELFVPGDALAHGEIRNLGLGGETCLDSQATKKQMNKPVSLYPCHGQGGNQYWAYSKTGEIRRDEMCIDYAGTDPSVYPCHGSLGNQHWIYDHETGLIRHGPSRKCLTIESKEKLKMEHCDEAKETHKWKFQNYKVKKDGEEEKEDKVPNL